MLENEHGTLILTDANVLIDYASSGFEVLALASEYLAPIVVPDVVLQEVQSVSQSRTEQAGITGLETPLALLAPDQKASKRLSIQDRVCLEMVSTNGWMCATNDKALRYACRERGVRLMWGLELMVELVDRGALSVTKAQNVGRKMHVVNPRSITDSVLRDFLARIHR